MFFPKQHPKMEGDAVFQITFKGRVPMRCFDGLIDAGLPTSSQVYHNYILSGQVVSFLGFLT